MNTLRTAVLLVIVGAIAVGVGAAFFGVNGAVIGLLIALAFQGISLFTGHKLALSFAHAQELPANELPWLHAATAELARKAGVPTPKLYISPDQQPNAFAAGWKPEVAVICVNQGLLRVMPQDQVIAVVAHEMGHIKNRDTLTMTVAAAMSSFINMLAYLVYFIPVGGDNRRGNPLVHLAILLLAPITATMIQLAISRTREYAADKAAADLVGTPSPMIEALYTLDRTADALPSQTARPATAHMYIASPFGSNGGGFGNLFRTHPTIEQRVAALRQASR